MGFCALLLLPQIYSETFDAGRIGGEYMPLCRCMLLLRNDHAMSSASAAAQTVIQEVGKIDKWIRE